MQFSTIFAILAAAAPAMVQAKSLGTPTNGTVQFSFHDETQASGESKMGACVNLDIPSSQNGKLRWLEVLTPNTKCYFWADFGCNNNGHDGVAWCGMEPPFSQANGKNRHLEVPCTQHTSSFRCYVA